jgi:hypothetical protein
LSMHLLSQKNIIVPQDNNDQLKIIGAVITDENTFARNINTLNDPHPNTPSEIIDYEGARYVYLFKDILSQPLLMKIREKNLSPY